MSQGTLPDVVERATITERSPPPIRTHCRILHAAGVELLAVGWKWGPEQNGPVPVAVGAMTRKVKGKDTEKEKRVRLEGYCGHCCEWGHRHEDCGSRQVSRVETDTAEPQDVDPTSEQTPLPVAALVRISSPGLPDKQWDEGRIRNLEEEIPADNDAVEYVGSEHYFSGVPTRSASRVVYECV